VEQNPQEIWFSTEVCSRAYYRMRSSDLTDLLAQMVARLRSIDEDSAYFLALRSLIRAWRETLFPSGPGTAPGGAEAHADVNATPGFENFLAGFDLPYRLRRLRFVAKKLDGLYGLRLDPENPAYQDALMTLRFGLNDPNPAAELPEGMATVRSQVGQQYRELKGLLDELLRTPEPKDTDTPAVKGAVPVDEGRNFVGSTLPPRQAIIEVLENALQIRGTNAASSNERGSRYATEATVRTSSEPGDLEALCDLRARDLLRNDTALLDSLKQLGNALRQRLEGVLDQAHRDLYQTFQSSTAGRVALRLYLYFDLFDAVQFPMMFGTDVVAAETVEILRIAPEDAIRLMPDLQQRRQKLKGLAVAHFGAFLDRDWRVSDLLWGRLDAAERLITALLPWEDSKQIRDELIDQAHTGIFADFGIQRKLKDMATRQVVAQGPENKLDEATVRKLVDTVIPSAPLTSVESHRELMEVWQDVVPTAMNRRSELETLARGSTIIGQMLQTIADKRNLAVKASWITNAGRAFWGVVEISVPRSAFRLLGTYWQSLLFLISAILIVAGVFSSQAGVASVGWSLFALALLLFTLRTILASHMRGGQALRAIAGILGLAVVVLAAVGAFQTYHWIVNFTTHLHAYLKSYIKIGS
jgi:hypothetical protein